MAELVIREETSLGLAAVMARRNIAAGALAAALGVELPAGPQAAWNDGLTALGTGPATWLLVDERGGPGFGRALKERLAGFASVSDQSSGYAVFRLSGEKARSLLQRGAYLDFDPSAFGAGSCVTTTIAHIGVIVWQAAEAPDFRVALFRSYSASFRHWLDTSRAAL